MLTESEQRNDILNEIFPKLWMGYFQFKGLWVEQCRVDFMEFL